MQKFNQALKFCQQGAARASIIHSLLQMSAPPALEKDSSSVLHPGQQKSYPPAWIHQKQDKRSPSFRESERKLNHEHKNRETKGWYLVFEEGKKKQI